MRYHIQIVPSNSKQNWINRSTNLDRLEDREGPSLDLDRDRDLRLSRDRLRDLDLLRRGDRERERDLDLERLLQEISGFSSGRLFRFE